MIDEKNNLPNNLEPQKLDPTMYSRALNYAKRLKDISKQIEKKSYEYDARFNVILKKTVSHEEQATRVSITPDGCKIIIAFVSDKTIRLFDFESSEEIEEFTKYSSGTDLITCSFDSHYIAFTSPFGSIHLFDVESEENSYKTIGFDLSATFITFSYNSHFVASGGQDGVISLWDINCIMKPKKFVEHSGPIKSISFSPDNRFFASVSDDSISSRFRKREKSIKVWNIATGKKVKQFEIATQTINSIVFSPNGPFLASGGDDKLICIWEIFSGIKIRQLEGHTSPVTCVSFSPDGLTVASGSHDGTLRLWDTKSGANLKTHFDMTLISAVGFSTDGTKVFAIGTQEIYVFSTPDFEAVFKQVH